MGRCRDQYTTSVNNFPTRTNSLMATRQTSTKLFIVKEVWGVNVPGQREGTMAQVVGSRA